MSEKVYLCQAISAEPKLLLRLLTVKSGWNCLFLLFVLSLNLILSLHGMCVQSVSKSERYYKFPIKKIGMIL